jgi:hypothetical protein
MTTNAHSEHASISPSSSNTSTIKGPDSLRDNGTRAADCAFKKNHSAGPPHRSGGTVKSESAALFALDPQP